MMRVWVLVGLLSLSFGFAQVSAPSGPSRPGGTPSAPGGLPTPAPNPNLGPIETIYTFMENTADALAFVCNATNGGALGTVPIAGMNIRIPGIAELLSGLDLRPICQYADIVAKTTRMVNGVLDGALGTTETFINEGLSLIAGAIGGNLDFSTVNEMVEGVGGSLRDAMELGPRALTQYRSTLKSTLSNARGAAVVENMNRASRSGAPSAAAAAIGEAAAIGVRFDAADRLLDVNMANETSTELIREQAENNAYQQTIEDVTRIAPPTPGSIIEPGLAQDIQDRARRANSVRQSMNVLTDGIAAMMRTEAVLTGAVIENLQSNARQQSITNHQLTQLTQHLVEQATAEAEREIDVAMAGLREAENEVDRAFEHLKTTLDEVTRSFESDAMVDYGFNFCVMFPSSCR